MFLEKCQSVSGVLRETDWRGFRVESSGLQEVVVNVTLGTAVPGVPETVGVIVAVAGVPETVGVTGLEVGVSVTVIVPVLVIVGVRVGVGVIVGGRGWLDRKPITVSSRLALTVTIRFVPGTRT